MDRHIFSAARRGDDRADLFEPTAFTTRAAGLGRSAAEFRASFAVRAAQHSLMVEQAGNCGRHRLRISRRNVSDEVAPSMSRKFTRDTSQQFNPSFLAGPGVLILGDSE
jgi:hypothetical protein